MTTAKELMHNPLSIAENSSVSQVISKLLDLNKSRLVITNEHKSVGIVTEKDVGFFLFAEKSNQSLDRIPLTQIMKGLVYADGATSVVSCAKKMIEKNISSLAVGNENNLEGIFTKTDLAKFYSIHHTKKYTVADYMTDHVFTVHDTASLTRVMAKMLEHKISRIITKDQHDNHLGVISFRDFFRVALELGVEDLSDDYSLSDHIRKGFVSSEGFGAITLASEIMTRGIFSIKSNQDLAKACRVMIDHNVSALGVLDATSRISGIISKTDVTRALASLA
ncbi:CBS domain-containing protein [Candidatus Nitrosotalea bavarica]|uniref:CBS domain-containing protein n=1 Tax=Candidatus Nitrosotalea bavarica TaxID=1903277 RepID=UPI001FE5EA6E|nr:CBS domain-containing protein [Candidatus Nitrosotalea bavarica]